MSLLPANIGLIMEEDASSLDDLFGSLDSFSEVNADGSLLMAVNYPSDGGFYPAFAGDQVLTDGSSTSSLLTGSSNDGEDTDGIITDVLRTFSTPTVVLNDKIWPEPLKVFHQPHQSSKLRYRTDYIRETKRIGSLRNKVKQSKCKNPAILIPNCFLNAGENLYICVRLVTVPYGPSNLRFHHPYELEHAKKTEYNDEATYSVLIPINCHDSLQSFPLLRIVKRRFLDIQKLGSLHVFDRAHRQYPDVVPSKHYFDPDADLLEEFSLPRSQLAFTVAKQDVQNGQKCTTLYTSTTVYSDEMIEKEEKSEDDNSSNEQTSPSAGRSCVTKYAPKVGMIGDNEEMLIFLSKKLDLKKSKKLSIQFKCRNRAYPWIQNIQDFHIDDRMISFRVPNFPYQITSLTRVEIILEYNNRVLDTLKYSYRPQSH